MKKNEKRKPIVIATPLYPPDIGGPATYAKHLADALSRRDIPVRTVSFSSVRRFPKGLSHAIYFFRVLRAAFGARIIYALDPTSVGVPSRVAAALSAKPFFVRIAGDRAWETEYADPALVKAHFRDPLSFRPRSFRARILGLFQTVVARSARRVIVPSGYVKKIVVRWGVREERIAVVENDIAPLPEKAARVPAACAHARRPLVVSAGRMVPWKGFDTLLDALSLMKERAPFAIIAGDGPEMGALREKARDLGIARNVCFPGALSREDLSSLLRASDIFILASGYEGFSHQILEAFSVGVPVVASAVGGNEELVTREETGILVPYGDALSLSRAMEYLFRNPKVAAEMARKGREKSAAYTSGRMVKETLNILGI